MFPELGILLNTPNLPFSLDSQYNFMFTFHETVFLWNLYAYNHMGVHSTFP